MISLLILVWTLDHQQQLGHVTWPRSFDSMAACVEYSQTPAFADDLNDLKTFLRPQFQQFVKFEVSCQDSRGNGEDKL